MNSPSPLPSPGSVHEVVLEREQPFAESMLWKLGRNFYDSKGPTAWASGVVPFFITSNPYIAHCYARVVLAFLTDLLNSAKERLSREQPIYILEIAAGHGKFSYFFLQELQELKAVSPLRDFDIRYIMADFAESNLAAWDRQELFEPLRLAGVLDSAQYDVEKPGAIHLRRSGQTLRAGELKNPLIVFANYIFDTVAQDLFRSEDQALYQGLVTLRYPHGASPDLGNPEVLSQLAVDFSYRPISLPYYDDRELDGLLAMYRERLASSDFLIPIAAIRCVRQLIELCGNNMLLLMSDKGYTHLDEMFFQRGNHVLYHGSFSCMVNFHALACIFGGRGGTALLTSKRNVSLKSAAYILGPQPEQLAATRHAFHEFLDRLGPNDYYRLLSSQKTESATVEQVLSLIYLSRFDPDVFCQLSSALIAQAASLQDSLRDELLAAMERLRARQFPIGLDLPFELSRVYLALSRPREALRCCQESLRSYGEKANTWCQACVCLYYAEEPAEALRCALRALELDPGHALARSWLARLQPDDPRASTAVPQARSPH